MSHPDTLPDDETYMTSGARAAVKDIKRTLHVLAAATILVYAVIIIAVLIIAGNAKKTHDALCDLRRDRQSQVENSQLFLQRHPNGVPGIPASVIQSQIIVQEQTVNSLASLGCADADPTKTATTP